MLTDDDLTAALRLAFDEATEDITPAATLATAVRRRHHRDRRRRVAFGVGVPAAAAAAVGTALALDASPSPAPAHRVQAGSTAIRASVAPPGRLAAYTITPPKRQAVIPCFEVKLPTAPNKSFWLILGKDSCNAGIVGPVAGLPSNAIPAHIAGRPGLYETTDPKAHTRTVYSRNPDGTWWALTVAADTPDSQLISFFVPEN